MGQNISVETTVEDDRKTIRIFDESAAMGGQLLAEMMIHDDVEVAELVPALMEETDMFDDPQEIIDAIDVSLMDVIGGGGPSSQGSSKS